MHGRVQQVNSICGEWCVDGEKLNVWINVSSLAIGILLEENRTILVNACWLCPVNNAAHINLRVGRYVKSQPSASVEGQEAVSADRFALCVPLAIRHSSREGQDSDQGKE